MSRAVRTTILRSIFLLLTFSLLLSAILARVSFNITQSGSDMSAASIKEILQPLPESIDSIYTHAIEEPMEELFSSVGIVGFSFTSTTFPASSECIARARSDLAAFVQSSQYLSKAFIYAVETDAYASSLPAHNVNADREMEPYFRDIIYAFNSGNVEKQMLASSDHMTFLFTWSDEIFIAKNLTTRTGQALSTVFAMLDKDAFSDALTSMFRLGKPYVVNIYDKSFDLMFSNSLPEEAITLPLDQLLSLSRDPTHIATYEGNYLFHYASNALLWNYVIIVGSDYLNVDMGNTIRNWQNALIAALMLILITVAVLWWLLRKPCSQILANIDNPEGSVKGGILRLVQDGSGQLATENKRLKTLVLHISDDVIKSLFSGLIIGQHYELKDVTRTLEYMNAGFAENDVYVAGVAKCPTGQTLSMEKRMAVLQEINTALDIFRCKRPCNTFSFATDMLHFAIIVSYPPEKSIAEGKGLTAELSGMIAKQFQSAGLELSLHFGHLYHSILDVGFSYSEACRAATDTTNDVSPAISETEAINEERGDTTRLDRRAYQIAELMYNDKEEEAAALARRTVESLFASGSYEERCAHAKYLLSTFIERLVSYDFVSHGSLTDVASEIYAEIENHSSDPVIQTKLYDCILTLCNDFSAVLKRQRNPYIKATLEYIGQNFANPDLSLDDIASHLDIAPNYLSNLFSKGIGVKLFDYINDIRIKKSVELLASTDHTISDIGLMTGFGSARNYIRVFKKLMNTTPGAYRKQASGIL